MENIIFDKGLSLIGKIIEYINAFFEDTSTYTAEILIPSSVLYRTQLICEYISSEQHMNFGLTEFVESIYYDFIRDSIQNYDPKKTVKMLITEYFDSDEIILSNGTDNYTVKRSNEKIYKVQVGFPVEEIRKCELILKEIYEIYRYRFSSDKLIEQLWFKYIYRYMDGENKKAVKELKNMFNEYVTRNYTN